MTAVARNTAVPRQIKLDRATLTAVLDVIAHHNPQVPRAALRGKSRVVAAMAAVAVRLSDEQQRRILANKGALAETMETLADALAGDVDNLVPVVVNTPVEESIGKGMFAPLDIADGLQGLTASAIPVRLEDWAGDVAGPGEIEHRYGIPRSTLHEWQKRGAVVGLLKGERKHVFPLAQFIDGRPVVGMSDILSVIGDPRMAWQWLVQPKPSIGGTPLDRLKAGNRLQVVQAAQRDFG